MIYYALIVFYLSDWKQQELVSIPVGPDPVKCTQVIKHRVSQQATLGNLKGHLSECKLLPSPK